MTDERYAYDEWVAQALRGVLRRALTTLSASGFTGDHHLFISFDTNHADVRMPGFLRAQYPDEITIVLQHQFEDLQVSDEEFQVSLSFSGQKHRLNVPFAAVRSFADPSVHFGLQISQPVTVNSAEPQRSRGSVPDVRRGAGLPEKIVEAPVQDVPAAKAAGSSARDHGAAAQAGAEVITLDAFRNKK